MSKRKYIILGVVGAIAIAVIVSLLIRQRNSIPSSLVATNLIGANFQFVDSIRQPDDNSIRFFTGTALASADMKGSTSLASNRLSSDTAFKNSKTVRESDSILAVKAFHDSKNSLLNFSFPKNANQQLANGDVWYIQKLPDGKVYILNSISKKGISDVWVDGDNIYYLSPDDAGQMSLTKIDAALDSPEALATNVGATTFVGFSKKTLIMRDAKGTLSGFKLEGTLSKIADSVGDAAVDNAEGVVVTATLKEEALSDEGGAVIGTSPTQELTLTDLDSGESKQVTLDGVDFFVANGFILSPSGLQQPEQVSYYQFSTSKAGKIKIAHSNSNVRDQIKNMLPLSDNLSRIAVVTNFNQLLFYQTPDSEAPKDYSLPKISDDLGQFGFDYNISRNLVTTYFSVGDEAVVSRSVSSLKSMCKCDINQINKQWQPFATEPGI